MGDDDRAVLRPSQSSSSASSRSFAALEIPVEARPRHAEPLADGQHLDLGHAVGDKHIAGDVQPVLARDLDVADERLLVGVVAVQHRALRVSAIVQLSGGAPPSAVRLAMKACRASTRAAIHGRGACRRRGCPPRRRWPACWHPCAPRSVHVPKFA